MTEHQPESVEPTDPTQSGFDFDQARAERADHAWPAGNDPSDYGGDFVVPGPTTTTEAEFTPKAKTEKNPLERVRTLRAQIPPRTGASAVAGWREEQGKQGDTKTFLDARESMGKGKRRR